MGDQDSAVAESNKQLAITFLDGLASGDQAAIRAPLADDAVLVLPRPTFSGTVINSAKNIAEAMAGLQAHYASPQARLSPVAASGSTVFAEWRLTATIADNGAPYDQFYCWVFTCAHGLITEIHEYQDTHYGFEAMGALAKDTLDIFAGPAS
ncbi:hypothetical protein JMUB5695_00805 [Mycobacterium heckeshornense]|uniref:nuclear transport factor 2 family protein n=1 Tax=Mycobacterium heckeshornense TaxID=110505 RepID=UPI001944E14A|nr:nuclear transport factor 2 family protein [Mycobacterium heckeshornense]BCQ07384.1 hypothetical protein JMUB5695_00805 [Mycobacterium heckeshornense]